MSTNFGGSDPSIDKSKIKAEVERNGIQIDTTTAMNYVNTLKPKILIITYLGFHLNLLS